MTRLPIILTVLALSGTALWTSAPIGAHTTKGAWTAFETEQRLTVGRFAATNGIAHATCLGVGAATNPKASEFSRRYRHLECKVLSKTFENERQLVVHVRTATAFTPQWLTTKDC